MYLFLFLFRSRQLAIHHLQQFTQERSVLYIIDEQHSLGTFIWQFHLRIRHQRHRRLCRLHEKAVIVNATDDLTAIVDDVFSHHGAIGYILLIRKLIQYVFQIYDC